MSSVLYFPPTHPKSAYIKFKVSRPRVSTDYFNSDTDSPKFNVFSVWWPDFLNNESGIQQIFLGYKIKWECNCCGNSLSADEVYDRVADFTSIRYKWMNEFYFKI